MNEQRNRSRTRTKPRNSRYKAIPWFKRLLHSGLLEVLVKWALKAVVNDGTRVQPRELSPFFAKLKEIEKTRGVKGVISYVKGFRT